MSLRELPEVRAFQRPSWLAFEAPEQNLEQFDPDMIVAEGDDDTVISIYGQIGVDPFSAIDNSERRISRALRAIGPKDITVNINTPGGNFFSGLAIYNLLRLHRAKVTINVVGQASSAGSVIAMAGDEILMADGAFMMVHNGSGVIVGNKYDVGDAGEILAEIDTAMAEIYAARAGVETETAAAWMDRGRGKGTFFNASRAIDLGLADGKLDQAAITACAGEPKQAPPERVLENALVAGCSMSPQAAKAYVSQFKAGTRDAPVDVTRDADTVREAIEALRKTITS